MTAGPPPVPKPARSARPASGGDPPTRGDRQARFAFWWLGLLLLMLAVSAALWW